MSTHNLGFYEELTKIIFELSSIIIKYTPYLFCCAGTRFYRKTSGEVIRPLFFTLNPDGVYT